MYRVVFDDGKPYEETFTSVETLKEAIKKFYQEHKDKDLEEYYSFSVYQEVDISDSELINNLVEEIRNEVRE